MELSNAYSMIEKQLADKNSELGFAKQKSEENMLLFTGDKGAYRIVYDKEDNIIRYECAYEDVTPDTSFKTVSKSLFDVNKVDDRDIKSLSNEINDEISSLFAARKKVDLEKIKMPKAVSRSKAKSGVISYDTSSLANRFCVLYPDLKEYVKLNIATYGEFLPETFFMEYGTPRVLDIIKNGTDADQKKLFKMLCEVYEDGTNEVQDIIGVTMLGEMKNDAKMMAVADDYMSEYMAGPVHEINKLTSKNNKYIKKLKNPPPFKPKKQSNMLQNALNGTAQR